MIVGPTVLMVRNGTGTPGGGRLIDEDELVDQRGAAPAVLGRPAEGQPAVPAELPDHLPVGLPVAVVAALQRRPEVRGHQPGEVRLQFTSQPLLLRRVGEVHPAALTLE